MLVYIKDALFKAIIGIILFAVIHSLSNLEFIRNNAEDYAFDLVNKVLEFKTETTDSPHVLLFGVDNHYLRQQQLLDKAGHTNYGYVFPRDKIAQFIQEIDAYIITLGADQQPKALFIDYDFSYGSDAYGKISATDKKLLEVLKIKRDYILLLPKTLNENFIIQSEDKVLHQLITDKKIRFVSVGITASKDGVNRRYLAYEKNRPSAVITLWQLAQNQPVDIKDIKTQFHDHEHKNYIVENRIFFKNYAVIQEHKNQYRRKQSYWDKLTVFSANYPLRSIPNEHFSNAILMLGSTHDESNDIFTVYNVLENEEIKGVEVHANALMTLFHLQGTLQAIDLITGMIIIFVLIFSLRLFTHWVIEKYFPQRKNKRFLGNLLFLIFIMSIMITLSITLLNYQIWFNWIIPVLILEVFEIIDYIKFRYFRKNNVPKF